MYCILKDSKIGVMNIKNRNYTPLKLGKKVSPPKRDTSLLVNLVKTKNHTEGN